MTNILLCLFGVPGLYLMLVVINRLNMLVSHIENEARTKALLADMIRGRQAAMDDELN